MLLFHSLSDNNQIHPQFPTELLTRISENPKENQKNNPKDNIPNTSQNQEKTVPHLYFFEVKLMHTVEVDSEFIVSRYIKKTPA